MDRQDILTLFEYTAWANARTFEAVAELSAEQFTKELTSSFPSIRDTLAHILGAEWVWLKRWQGESPGKLLAGPDYPTVASLRERFAAIEAERRTFIASLPEERLGASFDYRDLAGNPSRLPYLASMQHVVNHGTYHRGQVTTMLRQVGAKPVSTDLSRFYLERKTGG
jgi:uncharacterized damage-inducible protein DinB